MACGHPMVGMEICGGHILERVCLPSGNGHDYPVLFVSTGSFIHITSP